MKLDIAGSEHIPGATEALWRALNDPAVLRRCIPGCQNMEETSPDAYKIEMQLKVGAVSGSFQGEIALADKEPPKSCTISVSGAGSLGHGTGTARFTVEPDGAMSRLVYQGTGEIGGLVAGVGQRILKSASKYLIGRFFVALRQELENPIRTTAA
ncbi:MAG: carbon monoxide dehydrogenase subunit G [Hyphomicrobiaceae bacterium]|nr:carbon monoxide dehydrogenase subunit G [Hyphomicrobiaceae bacterium]